MLSEVERTPPLSGSVLHPLIRSGSIQTCNLHRHDFTDDNTSPAASESHSAPQTNQRGLQGLTAHQRTSGTLSS